MAARHRVEQRTPWVSTNREQHKLDESWCVSAKFNHAHTRDDLTKFGYTYQGFFINLVGSC